ncbi:mannose-1-phosphate guanylyltransferase [Candidatus Magnetomoraceae bacterium gMMP-1]
MIIPVILCGGSGTRLWPLSRQTYPKQLLKLTNKKTMLQNTVSRLSGFENAAEPIVVCNEHYRFMVAEQLREAGLNLSTIILEPEGRNTAPAVAVAALEAVDEGIDPVLLVLPADHVIRDVTAFRNVLKSAINHAEAGKLITFGIVPASPETGYGYIKALQKDTEIAFSVESFVEKPDFETACHYVDSGNYYWNSGMFMFKVSRYLDELEKFKPDMLTVCRKAHARAVRDMDFIRLNADAFLSCNGDSIDYAIMEKTKDAAVIPLDAGWSDVGSWSSVWEIFPKDENDNALCGDVLSMHSKRCLLRAEKRMLAVLGLNDIIIVETADAVLAAHKDYVQDIKFIVDKLKAEKRSTLV